MKKITMCLLLIFVAAIIRGQQTTTAPTLNKQDYLKKSKTQKTTAWVLLGGGVALGIGGAAWAGSDWEASGPGALMVIGGASVLGSIPLFIASGKNKKRAASMTIRNERIISNQKNSFVYKSIPSLSISIQL